MFSAQSDASAVVVKLFHGPNATRQAKRAGRAIIELNRRRATHPGCTPEFVELLPKRGILITRFIPGPDFETLLTDVSDKEIPTLLNRAAEWLYGFAQSMQETRQFDAAKLVVSTETRLSNLDGADQEYAGTRLRDRIKSLSTPHDCQDMAVVQSHGDFAPKNLILGPDATYGVDITELSLAPPERDIARFAVETCDLRDIRAFPTRFGISETVFAPFLGHETLNSGAFSEALLGAHVGLELLQRLTHAAPGSEKEAKLLLMIEAFLAHEN
ncbi:MAG: phosphotransferase [Rhodobacteraceae bacterium]|nr:phosphotransferase [Paracoccaceae bacterium]